MGKQTIDNEKMYRAIARIENTIGSFPTMGEYDQLKTNNDPSNKTIIARFKSWTDARSSYIEWKRANSVTEWHIDITVE